MSADLRDRYPAEKLKSTYERMISYWPVPPTHVEALEGYDDYPGRPAGDIGGVYVTIRCEEGYSEAVQVFVCRDEGEPRIRQIIWQRP